VKSNDSVDRRGVTNEYRRLFDVTDARDMIVTGIRWSGAGEDLRGEGEFAVTVRAKGRGAEQSYVGRLTLGVKRHNDNVVISELHHTYDE
jgi:hypothetical protein